MQAYRRLPPADQRRPCALTIGNFDGVHRGHRAIIERLVAYARAHGLASGVLTFEPHPREYFAHKGIGRAPSRISTLRDKLSALADLGLDHVNIAHFNDDLARQPAESFIEDLLIKGLQVRHLIVGDDFCFGAGRRGDIPLLERFARERAGTDEAFEVVTMPTVLEDTARISSSAVRAALEVGALDQAACLLGRPYCISGHVVHGRKLGRQLGFPTLNLRIPFDRPAVAGIYAVRIHGLPLSAGGEDGPGRPSHLWPGTLVHDGVASLGTRPAVESHGRPVLEVHVFDYSGSVYGRLVRVEFVAKLRDEADFDNLEALTRQIELDARQARARLGTSTSSI